MNNLKKQGIDIDFLVILLIIILFSVFIYTCCFLSVKFDKQYEYWVDGQKSVSNKCYIKNDIPVCLANGKEVNVDCYSETQK